MTDPEIIYEDENLLVINKPSGMLVHAARINAEQTRTNAENFPRESASSPRESAVPSGTLVEWLLKKYPEIKNVGDDPEIRPGIVHRLDKDTSGALIAAKNQKSFDYLKSLFQKREVKKIYLALVRGIMKNKKGIIDLPIGRKEGTVKRTVYSKKDEKTAETEYRVIGEFEKDKDFFSLLEVIPKTGRTHQIRVHLASIGHPVAGDKIYGSKNRKNRSKENRMMLHALSLEFTGQKGERLKIEAEPPEDFANVIKKYGALS